MKLNNNALWKAAGIGAAAALVLSLLNQIPLIGLLFCCLLWVAYAVIGALYGVFEKQNTGITSAGSAALGGAIAAGIAGIVQGIVGAIASAITLSGDTMTQALAQLEAQGMDIPPEMYDIYANMGPGVGILGGLIGLCFTLIIGAVLGAIGGAIYGATQKPSVPPAAPPPPPPTVEPYE